ncbi:MAG: thiol reductase thioredoxin [Myxococcales bacterium]|nr:thiol reductase thioredoxin [Myxococcales bacterium]
MSYALTRTCSSCGQRNRVPAARLADEGRCGACKAPLPPLAEPVDLQSVTAFDDLVREARVPVLVDFWAAWCGPCRAAAPELVALAQQRAGRAVIAKVNTEELPALAARYGVQAIPNFVVFSRGRLVRQQAGFPGRRGLESLLDQAEAA